MRTRHVRSTAASPVTVIIAAIALGGSIVAAGALVRAEDRAAEAASGPDRTAPDRGVRERIASRGFPSVFQAWSPAENVRGEDRTATMARHDLVFHSPEGFRLRWETSPSGLATKFTRDSIAAGRALRGELLARNSAIVLIAEIRYRDAHESWMPADHRWWRRRADGTREPGWEEGRYFQMDFSRADYRDHVALQARAAVETGVVDGVMLDWWQDDDARLELVRGVRASVGADSLILVNANDRTTPRTAPFVNGYFMECYRSRKAEDWKRIAETLRWAEENLREPRINCVETWYHESRKDLHLLRATTTLVLTQSDGYCLFSDPNDLPTPDHRHDWYPLWDSDLGKPRAAGNCRADGAWSREFERGAAVYNPMGNGPVRVAFPEERTSAATGKRAREHEVAELDGDVFLR